MNSPLPASAIPPGILPAFHKADQILLKKSLSCFVEKAFHTLDQGEEYLHGAHVDLMTEVLEDVHAGNQKRVIFNIPPRYMKSIACSVAFPAWVMGNDPTSKFICASNAENLTVKLSSDTNKLMKAPWYKSAFPDTIIARDNDTKQQFSTTETGGRYATTVGGQLIGFGGNYIIIDDPHKAGEVMSMTRRKAVIDWYSQGLVSRLNNKKDGAIILVMQRLHTDDLSGYLESTGNYNVYKIPAIARKDIYYVVNNYEFRMERGQVLHPEREDKDMLQALRREMTAYAFDAQYMQEPVPVGGGMFKSQWLRYFDVEPSATPRMNLYICVDPANSDNKNSDYTAMMVVGLGQDKNYYVLDMVRERLATPHQRIKTLIELHIKWSEYSGKPPTILYEKARGMMTDDHWITQLQKELVYNMNVLYITPTEKKISRIESLSPLFENGRIYIPKVLPFTDNEGIERDLTRDFIEQEYNSYPSVVHDDMLDSLAMIMNTEHPAHFPLATKQAQLAKTTKIDRGDWQKW